MEIYLIRHTTPDVEAGTCYGQSDIDVAGTFAAEAEEIKRKLPSTIAHVVSSPLRRCRKLAAVLFPVLPIEWIDDLKEIDCGEWEMKRWNDIPESVSREWMDDFVRTPFPDGENYVQLQARVIPVFNAVERIGREAAIVAHGGVIRSILAHITQTPLEESFDRFPLPIGCVIRLRPEEGAYAWEHR